MKPHDRVFYATTCVLLGGVVAGSIAWPSLVWLLIGIFAAMMAAFLLGAYSITLVPLRVEAISFTSVDGSKTRMTISCDETGKLIVTSGDS